MAVATTIAAKIMVPSTFTWGGTPRLEAPYTKTGNV
jgi:hypothetical protein